MKRTLSCPWFIGKINVFCKSGFELIRVIKNVFFQMKRYAKFIVVTAVLVIIFNIVPKIAHAQVDPGQDPDAPIDGGVSLLVAAGIGYGIKKVKDNKKK